jgi:hypothetical protein
MLYQLSYAPTCVTLRLSEGARGTQALRLLCGSFVLGNAPHCLCAKLVEPSGFEPLTSSLPAKRSTN